MRIFSTGPPVEEGLRRTAERECGIFSICPPVEEGLWGLLIETVEVYCDSERKEQSFSISNTLKESL